MSGSVQTSGRTLTDRILNIWPRLSYRLAVDVKYRRDIFRLRHDAYVREGAIPPRDDGLFRDEIDDSENTYLFGVHIDGALMSSIRLSVATLDTPDIPSGHVFPDVLEPEIRAGRIVVDPTRFVVDHASSRLHSELPYLTLRLAWIAMEHFEADLLLAAVRPEHAPFYRRFWNTQAVTEARTYPPLTKPITLTLAEYSESREVVQTRYPFLASTALERRRLFAGDFSSRGETFGGLTGASCCDAMPG